MLPFHECCSFQVKKIKVMVTLTKTLLYCKDTQKWQYSQNDFKWHSNNSQIVVFWLILKSAICT